MSYCGQQYTGKKCECQLQVTPGVNVATKEAANPQRICAFREDGIQYPCDAGCCPEDCPTSGSKSNETVSTSVKSSIFESPWFIILVSILFAFIGLSAIIYRHTLDAR
jgi:hypothetical protein